MATDTGIKIIVTGDGSQAAGALGIARMGLADLIEAAEDYERAVEVMAELNSLDGVQGDEAATEREDLLDELAALGYER